MWNLQYLVRDVDVYSLRSLETVLSCLHDLLLHLFKYVFSQLFTFGYEVIKEATSKTSYNLIFGKVEKQKYLNKAVDSQSSLEKLYPGLFIKLLWQNMQRQRYEWKPELLSFNLSHPNHKVVIPIVMLILDVFLLKTAIVMNDTACCLNMVNLDWGYALWLFNVCDRTLI